MERGRKKIKVIYTSTNKKELKDVVQSLIKIHERKYSETIAKKVANG